MACVAPLPWQHRRDDITAGRRGREGGRGSQRPLDWARIPCICTCEPSVHPYSLYLDKQELWLIIPADDKRDARSEISHWNQTTAKTGFSRTNFITAVFPIAVPVCFHRLWWARGVSFISNRVPCTQLIGFWWNAHCVNPGPIIHSNVRQASLNRGCYWLICLMSWNNIKQKCVTHLPDCIRREHTEIPAVSCLIFLFISLGTLISLFINMRYSDFLF